MPQDDACVIFARNATTITYNTSIPHNILHTVHILHYSIFHLVYDIHHISFNTGTFCWKLKNVLVLAPHRKTKIAILNDFFSFPTTFMLWVSFSPVPECVVSHCWKRPFRTPLCHQSPVVIVIVVIVAVVLYPCWLAGWLAIRTLCIHNFDIKSFGRLVSLKGRSNYLSSNFFKKSFERNV